MHSPRAWSQEPAADALETKWGLYARLVGTEKEAPRGYRLRWTWTQPEVELLEEWIEPRSGKVKSKIVITLGSKPGEFRLKGIWDKIWNGTRRPDGSIVYIGEGFAKFPYCISLSADGLYELKDVHLRGSEVIAISPATPRTSFAPVAGAEARPSAAAAATAEAPPTVALVPPTPVRTEPAGEINRESSPLGTASANVPSQGGAKGESLEQSYATLCSAEGRSETCEVLRKALLEKLKSGDQPARQAAASEADTARVARWGFIGRDALNGSQLVITESMTTDAKFSNYVYGAMLLEYQWISDTELRKKTTQLEVTTYSWGYGSKGEAKPLGADSLASFEEILRFNGTQPKIEVTQRFLSGALQGSGHKYELDVQPAENYGKPFYREYPISGKQGYSEVTYQGDNREYVGGHIEAGERKPTSYVRTFKTSGVSRAQIDAMIAEERQRFHGTISQFHQRQASSDGWLRALIGAGVGLAAGQAYGLDSTQTLGAVMKGIQITGNGSAAAAAAGAMGDQLISGAGSAPPAGTSGSARAGHQAGSPGATGYAMQPPADLSQACSGFTESNYRTLAVNAPGDDAHLYAACGQAFELYSMYKNAVKQGYSESDSMRTYQAHVGAAQNALDYYRTRRAK
jgi:hypothetical protein